MEKTPAETLIRHRQYRELFETFTLFFSLALLLLCAGTLMIKIQAPPLLDRDAVCVRSAIVALYLNRRLRSQAIHDLNAVNYCT
jgi:hypothetical protein